MAKVIFINMGDSSGIQKILRNPAYGLLPLLIFSLILGQMDTRIAIAIGLILSGIGYFAVKKYSRLMHQISVFTFGVSLILSFLAFRQLSNFMVFLAVEIIFVLSIIYTRLSRPKIVHRLAKSENLILKNYLSESFRVAFQTQYGLSIHLLLILLFFIFGYEHITAVNRIIAIGLAQIFLVIIIIMEAIRLNILDKKLYDEEWLPVVNEKGAVTGKIAKSVTKDMKNKFMHPVVRVALIHKGKIYLKKRDSSRILDPGKLDYPFEKYMKFKHELDEAVHNAIRKETGMDDIPLRFLLKYIFENAYTKRLIFLYVSDIRDDSVYNALHLKDGKLWTEAQIDDNMGTGIFSECLELEYEYLKNTVLLAHQHFVKPHE